MKRENKRTGAISWKPGIKTELKCEGFFMCIGDLYALLRTYILHSMVVVHSATVYYANPK